ncbi:hypothetical protein G7Y89_g5119 [Cudoniella acicularis]|uniref:F-box domain-containing protein n=1 Tax=Cudoniella acicularis TaxID=354080 RepID=A0A8H4W4A9_9HELO|nr:hypothetical protein G7Y89_g5119 [Cudoniella acicularis]
MSSEAEIKAQALALKTAFQAEPPLSPNDTKNRNRLKRIRPPLAWVGKTFKQFGASINVSESPNSQPQRPFSRDGTLRSRRQSLDIGPGTEQTSQVQRTLSFKPSGPGSAIITAKEVALSISQVSRSQPATMTFIQANAPNTPLATRKPCSNTDGSTNNLLSEENKPDPISKVEPPDLENNVITLGEGSSSIDIINKLQDQLQETCQELHRTYAEIKNQREDKKHSDETWQRRVCNLENRMKDNRLESDKDHAEILRKNREIQELHSQLSLLRDENNGKVASINRELECITSELEAKRQETGQVPRLAEQNHKLRADVDRLRDERDTEMKEANRLRIDLDWFVQQKASEAAPVDLYHFDDTFFARQFSVLRGDIKNWATRGFSLDTTKVWVPESMQNSFASVTPHWQEYMASNEHRPAFVQAFVWKYLLYSVFRRRVWETNGEYASALLDEYFNATGTQTEMLKLCHEWRSIGARLAALPGMETKTVERKALARISRAVEAIGDPLKQWLTMDKTQAYEMLQKTIKSAVVLDLQMQQQKAFFGLFGAQHLSQNIRQGLGSRHAVIEYSDDTMDIRYGKLRAGRPAQVALFIAPLLRRVGSPDGRTYDSSLVIENAQVDVEAPSRSRAKMWSTRGYPGKSSGIQVYVLSATKSNMKRKSPADTPPSNTMPKERGRPASQPAATLYPKKKRCAGATNPESRNQFLSVSGDASTAFAENAEQVPSIKGSSIAEASKAEATRKDSLLSLPPELILIIFENLDKVTSTCLGLTCFAFWRIHAQTSGKVKLHDTTPGPHGSGGCTWPCLIELLKDWMAPERVYSCRAEKFILHRKSGRARARKALEEAKRGWKSA